MARRSIPVYELRRVGARLLKFQLQPLEDAFATTKDDVLAEHRHDHFEIFWITGGQGVTTVDFVSYDVRPWMLYFISPGQVHSWRLRHPARGYLLSFTNAFFAGGSGATQELADMPLFYAVNEVPILQVNESNRGVFDELCGAMEQEQARHLPDTPDVLRSYLRILLIHARRLHARHPGRVHPEEAAFLLTKRFLFLVEAHFLTTSSVAAYASMLRVTTNHLIATVKRAMGKPAGQIVRERLLLEAQRLLRHSDQTVSEIAYHLKFDDPSYFSRFFRKHKGVSPVEFREDRGRR